MRERGQRSAGSGRKEKERSKRGAAWLLLQPEKTVRKSLVKEGTQDNRTESLVVTVH